jgi:predicted site-specific integrase-resolvase
MSSTTANDELVTTARACAELGVNRTTLFRYMRWGWLHPLRLPTGHRRYKLAELREVMQRRDGRWLSR